MTSAPKSPSSSAPAQVRELEIASRVVPAVAIAIAVVTILLRHPLHMSAMTLFIILVVIAAIWSGLSVMLHEKLMQARALAGQHSSKNARAPR